MTPKEAFEHLINSEKFKADAAVQTSSTLRVNLRRYRTGEMKTGAMIDLLMKYGYTVIIKPPKSK